MAVEKFDDQMKRIDGLVATVESWPEGPYRTTALELVQALMDFHGAGLSQMMEITANAGAAGYAIFDDLAKDDMVASLLLLYDLHPRTMDERVLSAIESVRPSLGLHDGDVEVNGIEQGVVSLSLKGSCDGCPSSALTLKTTIEEAIYAAAPDVRSIVVTPSVAEEKPAGLVQIGKPQRAVYTDCEFCAAA